MLVWWVGMGMHRSLFLSHSSVFHLPANMRWHFRNVRVLAGWWRIVPCLNIRRMSARRVSGCCSSVGRVRRVSSTCMHSVSVWGNVHLCGSFYLSHSLRRPVSVRGLWKVAWGRYAHACLFAQGARQKNSTLVILHFLLSGASGHFLFCSCRGDCGRGFCRLCLFQVNRGQYCSHVFNYICFLMIFHTGAKI